MLTSNEAKTKTCPHVKKSVTMSNGVFVYQHANCKGNECPRWRTAYLFGLSNPCAKGFNGDLKLKDYNIKECQKKHNVPICAQCGEAFGYCGVL